MPARRKIPLKIEVTESHLCSVDLRLKILAGLPFFADVKAADLQGINRLFREYAYTAGGIICAEGDLGDRLFVVADGRVKLMRHSLSGKTVLLDMLTQGEFFGSLSGAEDAAYPDTAQAQTETCVLSIPRSDFRRLLEAHPSISLRLLEITSTRLHAAQARIQELSGLSVEGRIANLLLLLGRKFGRPGDLGLLIDSPLSRDDLAAMAGTTTESASRVMSQFQKDRLIHTGRKWVSIVDLKALEVLGAAEPR